MKHIFFTILLLVVASVAGAFGPIAFSSESKTKGTTTVSTQYADEVLFRSSAAATVTINGTGTSYPVAANTDYVWSVKPGVTSLVFSRTSSATATVIYSAR